MTWYLFITYQQLTFWSWHQLPQLNQSMSDRSFFFFLRSSQTDRKWSDKILFLIADQYAFGWWMIGLIGSYNWWDLILHIKSARYIHYIRRLPFYRKPIYVVYSLLIQPWLCTTRCLNSALIILGPSGEGGGCLWMSYMLCGDGLMS